jgi:tRNA(Ile)-lysidine synthetase-like protein
MPPPPPRSSSSCCSSIHRTAAASSSASSSSAAPPGDDEAGLYDEVEQALKGPCGVTRGGSRLVVAVSGGSDSVALLHLLAGVRDRWRPPLQLRVAHFNHGLRLPEADEEVAFVQQLGEALRVPVHVGRWAEAERAKPTGVQARSRAWRRAECRRLLLAQEEEEGEEEGDGEGFVVTAHQADDQMETWALKLLRGTHLSHLRGMTHRTLDGWEEVEEEMESEEEEEEPGIETSAPPPAAGAGAGAAAVAFLKPLLDVPKARLVRFLQARGLAWREDASNAEAEKYKRNRVRLQLLPLMRELAGGEQALRSRVAALSAQSLSLDAWLAAEAARWEAAAGQGEEEGEERGGEWRRRQRRRHALRGNELWVGVGALVSSAVPRLVQEEVLHRFVARATRGELRALPYAQVDRVLGRLTAREGKGEGEGEEEGARQWRLCLARGWALEQQGAVLRVLRLGEGGGEEAEEEAAVAAGARVLAFPEAGLEIVGLPRGWGAAAERLPPQAAADAEAEAEAEAEARTDGRLLLVLHGLPMGTRLVARRRRDGDRFHPSWRPAPVKLKDFLRGQRVPLHRRDEVLLLCLEEEQEEEAASVVVVVALVDPPFVARPFCGGVASSSEPGAAAVALRLMPPGEEEEEEEEEDGVGC